MNRFTSFVLFLFAAASLTLSTAAKADRWYPSPTGWRGPIRDAGRPWLRGTPYEPPSYSKPAYNAEAARFVANTWYLDGSQSYYWLYDRNTGVHWYYYLSTGTYAHR